MRCGRRVALLAEGVDRNLDVHPDAAICAESPSSRRAWIEMHTIRLVEMFKEVALLAEGVDRNTKGTVEFRLFNGRPPRGGRG